MEETDLELQRLDARLSTLDSRLWTDSHRRQRGGGDFEGLPWVNLEQHLLFFFLFCYVLINIIIVRKMRRNVGGENKDAQP